MAKGVAIGLTSLYYAKLLSDVVGGVATYETPVRLAGAITANFSPNASNDTLFADDGPYETASSLGAMSLEINVADIPAADRAALLGHTYGENGILISKASDIPPYVAVGMSVLKSNGFSRLLWYLKGKFTAPDDNNQTKADSINWNTPTMSGNFLKRDCDGQWRVAIDTDDTKVQSNPTLISDWFTTPNVESLVPSSQYALTLTQTGVGATLINNALYTGALDFGEGEVVIIKFPEAPSVFTVGGTDRKDDIENGVFAMAMPAAATAVAITYA